MPYDRPLLDRRGFTLAALAAGVHPLAAQAGAPAAPLARVEQGTLRGVETDGIRCFKGIPFASAPIGDLRFRPPAPPMNWQGIRDASEFAAAPIQPPPPGGMSHRTFLRADTSEDCLYLNVWQPEGVGPHPVLVWIHGGGNVGGAASQSLDGTAFAKSGIVCVTIGYRLGVFGFLELGELLGPDYRGSSVNGLRDQIAALRWIRKNIAGFGGDPARVTICGASAGGKNVVTLMASPQARGLFSSAIVESGGQMVYDLQGARRVARDYLGLLKAGPAALQTMAADELNAQQMPLILGHKRPFPFRAIVGTDVVPKEPLIALARRSNCRRLLIGSNRDEAIGAVNKATASDAIAQREVSGIGLDLARKLFAEYQELYPGDDPVRRRVRFLAAAEYVIPCHRVADAVRGQGASVWLYEFAQQAPSGPFAGWAVHGSEAMYIWKALDDPLLAATFGRGGEAAHALGNEMHSRWAAFIHGRAPDNGAAIGWPRYDGAQLLRFENWKSGVGRIAARESEAWKNVPFGLRALTAGNPLE